MEPLAGLHFDGELIAMPTNIRLGWKRMEAANTPAYYDTATFTALIFLVKDPWIFA
jgi:hypothetical protein